MIKNKRIITTDGVYSRKNNSIKLIYKFNKNIIPAISDNLVLVGSYTGTCIVYDSNKSYNIGSSVSDTTDAFIVNYDNNGLVKWLTKITGTGSEIPQSNAVDSNNNLYVAGNYDSDIATIYNAGGSKFIDISGSNIPGIYYTYIVKYDANGLGKWTSTIKTNSNSVVPSAITVDSDSNSYILGYYESPIIIYNSDGTIFNKTIDNSGGLDSYIIKYNTNGIAQWISHISGNGNEQSYGNTIDINGNLCVTGSYTSNPVKIYHSNGIFFQDISNGGGLDSYIVKYNTNGFAQWTTRISGINDENPSSIGSDSNGNYYVCGYYTSGEAIVYNSDKTIFNSSNPLINNGGSKLYLVKYNINGFGVWKTHIGGSNDDPLLPSNAVDKNGNCYITGFSSSTDLKVYNSDGSSIDISNNMFVVKYDTNGFVQWTANIETIIGGEITPNSITIDSNGDVIISAYFTDSITIYNKDKSFFSTVTRNPGDFYNGLLVKYDKNGFVQWTSNISSLYLYTSNISCKK